MSERFGRQSGADDEDAFSAFIDQLDAGAIATLRRSLAFPPGTWPGAFPYVERWVLDGTAWKRNMYYLTAGLQASSRVAHASGSLGDATRRLSQVTDSASIEKRFMTLLESDGDELPHRLRQLITLMGSAGIAPDWGRLRRDLIRWHHPDKWIQVRWARDYYIEEAK